MSNRLSVFNSWSLIVLAAHVIYWLTGHLPDSSPIKQVISIRGRKPDKYMSAKERANLNKLKELYRLVPNDGKPEMTAAEIEAAILAT